jgi:hypothetical protein
MSTASTATTDDSTIGCRGTGCLNQVSKKSRIGLCADCCNNTPLCIPGTVQQSPTGFFACRLCYRIDKQLCKVCGACSFDHAYSMVNKDKCTTGKFVCSSQMKF